MTRPLISPRLLREALDNAAAFGSIVTLLVVIVAAWATNRVLARRLTLSFIIGLFLLLLIKLFYFRERPRKEPGKGVVDRIVASSFPSMHTINAVNLAVNLSASWPILLPLMLLLLALTMVQRVVAKKHFVTDVLGGLLVGGIAAAVPLL